MLRRILLTSIPAVAAVLGTAQHAAAQAVQLPTFHYFGVQTTVSVPDRGGVVLGGVNTASSGSTTRGFGPFANRASGSTIGASTASVYATIIDHREWDAAVLAEAARRRAAGNDALVLGQPAPRTAAEQRVADKATFLSQHVATRAPEHLSSAPAERAPVESLAEIRARAAARDQARQAEAEARLSAGIASEEAGKLASARGHYEAAMRYGDENIRAIAFARHARIALPPRGSLQASSARQ
jgi:hypothetical protein